MGSLPHYLTVFQHQNQIRIPDGGRPLGDHEGGGGVGHIANGLAEPGIGGKVQGRGAVVQNQDSGAAHQGSGYSQPLSLSAGEVKTCLLHGSIQAALPLHDLQGLGNFQSLSHILIGSLRVTPLEVLPDGSPEQNGLLGYQSNLPGDSCMG